jgi:hypothetical protein
MAVFLGDIIDRGPRIREALHIVHDMVEAGQALCIMGNHEFNALGWATPAPPGSGKQFVREHTRGMPADPRNPDPVRPPSGDWHDFLSGSTSCRCSSTPGVSAWCMPAGTQPDRTAAREFPDGCIDEHFVQASAVPAASPAPCATACCAAPTCACRTV